MENNQRFPLPAWKMLSLSSNWLEKEKKNIRKKDKREEDRKKSQKNNDKKKIKEEDRRKMS